jgi:hypothetical protein
MLAALERKNGERNAEGVLSTLEKIQVPVVTAHRWQKLAAIPEDKFEQAVEAAKVSTPRLPRVRVFGLPTDPQAVQNIGSGPRIPE